jgi:hypothetical protein
MKGVLTTALPSRFVEESSTPTHDAFPSFPQPKKTLAALLQYTEKMRAIFGAKDSLCNEFHVLFDILLGFGDGGL